MEMFTEDLLMHSGHLHFIELYCSGPEPSRQSFGVFNSWPCADKIKHTPMAHSCLKIHVHHKGCRLVLHAPSPVSKITS